MKIREEDPLGALTTIILSPGEQVRITTRERDWEAFVYVEFKFIGKMS